MIKKTAGQHRTGHVLVLLHGFSGSRLSWQPLAQHLSWDGPILLPDLPGAGHTLWPEGNAVDLPLHQMPFLDSSGFGNEGGRGSDLLEEVTNKFGSNALFQPDGGPETGGSAGDSGGLTPQFSAYSGMGVMAHAVEAWLDAQGVDSFVVVGHSMGGYVALELLKRIPNRILGLGLFHSHPLADDENKRANRLRNLDLIRQTGHTRFMDAFVPALFAPERVDACSERIRELRAIASNQNPRNICRQIEAMMERSDRLNLLLEHHDLPKWVVLGDQDPVLPLAGAWDWVSRLDNLQLDILPSTGHMGMDECPGHCIRFFEGFNHFVRRSVRSWG